MSEASTTTDHEVIRKWVEARDGKPARVKDAKGSGDLLRIDFDPPEDSLEEISWEQFFETFEAEKLAFLHQDLTEDGQPSRFNKLIDRD